MSDILQRILNILHITPKKRRSLDTEHPEHLPKHRKLQSAYNMDHVDSASTSKYTNAFVPRDGPDFVKNSNIPNLSLRKHSMPHLNKRRTNGFLLVEDDDDDNEAALNHNVHNNISSRPEYIQLPAATGKSSTASMPPPPLLPMVSRFARPPMPSLRKISSVPSTHSSYGLQMLQQHQPPPDYASSYNRNSGYALADNHSSSVNRRESSQRPWVHLVDDAEPMPLSYAAAVRNGLGGQTTNAQCRNVPAFNSILDRPPTDLKGYKGLLDRLKNQQGYPPMFSKKKPSLPDTRQVVTIDLLDATSHTSLAGESDYGLRNVPLAHTINLSDSAASLQDAEIGIDELANQTATSCRVPVAALSSLQLNESDEPKLPPVNSLQAKLESKPEFQASFLEEVNQRYSNRQKTRQEQIDAVSSAVEHQVEEVRRQERVYRARQRKEWQVRDAPIIVLEPEDVPEEEYNDFPAFTAEQRNLIGELMRPHPPTEVLINKFGIHIKRNDIQTLEGLNWLNDEVINFYMNLLTERSSLCPDLPKVYAFSTFFLTRLMASGHSGVRRWTRKVEIFKYDLVPVPVHVSGVHWCMAIIDFRHKTIRFYDSMLSKNPQVLKVLADWLVDEHRDKLGSDYDLTGWAYESMMNIPRQNNSSDCGVFSCAFAETIARNRPILFSQKNMPYLRRKMVLEICTGKMLL